VPTATRLIAAAHRRADVVVVYMHNGAEGSDAGHVTGQEETYLGEDRGNAQVFARAAIDAGADAVIGSGPHVLRGIEFYKGHLIAYSLGNFANFHDFQATGVRTQSAILRVTLTGDGHWVGGQITSVVLSAEGRPAIDSTGAAARTMNALSTADFGPAAGLIAPIAATGQITPPGP
jgi:poly-gamma-glutamate capsule biosynthesis protein CapA/YwtB (metallophosphatase superfamily)